MRKETLRLEADDGHIIGGTCWLPDGEPRASLQIFHGLGEHHARYHRFAVAACDRGFAVVAHDHRGHGAKSNRRGYFADDDGWQKLVDDARRVRTSIANIAPVHALLGHSMGSYIAQSYVMQYASDHDALILSASTWAGRIRPMLGHWLARLIAWRFGKTHRSALLDQLGFGEFNKPFEPARTPLDWLSRDANEVDRYVADPLCGGPYTCSLWMDITHALASISQHSAIRCVPAKLPILMMGGSADPVGGQTGIERLASHYRATLHENVCVTIYEDGRHEMLNESNRDEVTRDLLDWVESRLPAVSRA